MTDPSTPKPEPASDEEIARWQEIAITVRNNHASEIQDRFITLPWIAMYLSDLKSVLARIEADRARIRELEEKNKSLYEQYWHLVEYAHDRQGLEAELATASEQIKAKDEEIARVTRSVYGALESLCECGGKGPCDAGACDACRIYHAFRAALSEQGK